jgi:uncharacterized YigZ family protein
VELTDSIKTISSNSESKFKEKGSVFIGQAYPVKSEEEAENILSDVKKKFYDATHHCYAYKLLDEKFKYSDDGEPNGTAGIRILNAVNHFELVNVFVVVIRYYGGTKLGVGPLGKAYYKSAFDSLKNAKQIKKIKYHKAKIEFDYNLTSQVHHYLNEFDTKVIQNTFDPFPAIEFLIQPALFKKFTSLITEATKNQVKVSLVEKNIFI